ncbi:site-specific integrase [Gracilibacillus sp. YIM 98692]|uniref:site-specific integrase n=1 Tax=Gracilibacillus sp. YIM 98692 TaxID=2663532 RepID=UPI0013D396B0|nr:site-specific integrase [Gracilibacillus sp. YIM 98692]
MNVKHAVDDFLMYLAIEKNYSENTVNGYSYDLKTFEEFLVRHNRALELTEMYAL